MRQKRLAAGIVAAALLVGSVGLAVVNSGSTSGESLPSTNTSAIVDNDNSFAYGTVQSLYFKINELWRLSINSDLSAETTAAISALNSGFDSELLERAIDAEGDEVIDEYIYSVLAGLDFELCLDDKAAYKELRDKTEYTGEVLTQASIDEYLNQLNKETANAQVNAINSVQGGVKVPTTRVANDVSTAMPQAPTAPSILPENPAEAIRKETDAITSSALGIEVR